MSAIPNRRKPDLRFPDLGIRPSSGEPDTAEPAKNKTSGTDQPITTMDCGKTGSYRIVSSTETGFI
jgi:hypothetical protein